MAFTNGTWFEVRSTGSNNNSGGFNKQGATPGTDRTQQDAAHVDIDGVTITATVHTTTTQITLTGYTVSAADIRNTIKIKAGGTSAVTGYYEITAVDVPNNRWTMSSSMGTAAQTVQALMGGGWADFTNVLNSANLLAGTASRVYFKGDFSLSGVTQLYTGAQYIGYGTTRGDSTFSRWFLPANRTTVITLQSRLRNIDFDCAGFSMSSAIPFQQAYNVVNCRARANGGTLSASPWSSYVGGFAGIRLDCYVEGFNSGTTVGAFQTSYSNDETTFINCVALNCNHGFRFDSTQNGTKAINCLAIGSSGNGFYAVNDVLFYKCTAIGCGVGFQLSTTSVDTYLRYCLTVNSTTYGYDTGTSQNGDLAFISCAAYSSGTADVRTAVMTNVGFITLSANPITNIAGGDYTINNAVGGGASLRSISKTTTGLASTLNYVNVHAIDPVSLAGSTGLVGGILGS